tara:strand:- start:1 stop:438 length:438 start_codon:yes stop_codon:yes gene_type:complete
MRLSNEAIRRIVRPIATKVAEGVAEGMMQFLSEADLDDLGLGEAKVGEAKTKTPPPKEEKTKVKRKKGVSKKLATGLAELADAVEIHKEDFDNSVLAEEARKRFNGKCGMWSICMTWAILNKNPEVKRWVEPQEAKHLRKWYNKL